MKLFTSTGKKGEKGVDEYFGTLVFLYIIHELSKKSKFGADIRKLDEMVRKVKEMGFPIDYNPQFNKNNNSPVIYSLHIGKLRARKMIFYNYIIKPNLIIERYNKLTNISMLPLGRSILLSEFLISMEFERYAST